jgi:predicted acyltransferase
MTSPTIVSPPAPATRLVSLDVFRGLTMAAMTIVNNPGDWNHVYWPLLHAEWHGWTPTDLVFPFFLFIVGVSITLSRRGGSWSSIARRTAIIFALGLCLNAYPHVDLATWRIPGVLQRIAVCYGVAAAALHLTKGDRQRQGLVMASLAGVLICVYWLVMTFVPAPGSVAGDLSPEGNLAAWVDRTIMPGHLYKPHYDPEGLLSTVPAIATTLMGIVAGLWLGSTQSSSRKASLLAAAGIACVLAGLAWDVVFPINKALWTSSYVMLTGGLASMLLALCYWVIDVRGWRGGTTPFVILGVNAITLYVLSGLLVGTLEAISVALPGGGSTSAGAWIFARYFAPLAAPKTASLLYACAHLALLFAVLAWMYRRRIFVRV